MKTRVIPSILTNGLSQVKGEGFNNWRTVGTVMQAVRVQSARDVDEIVVLDVNASKEGRLISPHLVQDVARSLRVPLTVGGGIRSVDDVAVLLKAGADKVIIGTAAHLDEDLVPSLAREFGSQAIVVSVDALGTDAQSIAILSGAQRVDIPPADYAQDMVSRGAGELLVQHVDRDGKMEGLNHSLVEELADSVSVPVLASSGLASPHDALLAAQAGASAIVAGAILQFTQVTPLMIKDSLVAGGFDVRR